MTVHDILIQISLPVERPRWSSSTAWRPISCPIWKAGKGWKSFHLLDGVDGRLGRVHLKIPWIRHSAYCPVLGSTGERNRHRI